MEWRRNALTASDIGAVAGVDPYRSGLSVYADKISGVTVDETPLMRRGRHYEAAAVEYFREDHPDWKVETNRHYFEDVDLKLGATPDVIAVDPEGRKVNVQIKTVGQPTFEKWDGQPPKAYLLQTAAENYLTGADYGILAVLVNSTYAAELVEFEVLRHPAAERRVCDLTREFWENVKAGVVPQPDYERDGELVAKLFPPDAEVPVPLDLSGDNRIGELLADREKLKEAIKTCESGVKTLDAEILHKLGGATMATLPGWKITNKLTHRKEYVVAASSFPRLLVKRLDTEEEAA